MNEHDRNALVAALWADYTQAHVSPGDRAMLDWMQAKLDQRLTDTRAPYEAKLTTFEGELATSTAEYSKIQGELDFWQREFEREVNGQRSGIVGLGPRARSIRDDQLEWRRDETKRGASDAKPASLVEGNLGIDANEAVVLGVLE